MALRFKVETLEDAVRFKVKGVEVELSYHAASALCNTIFSECDQRKEFQSNKFDYWRKQGRNGHKVKVRPTNKKPMRNSWPPLKARSASQERLYNPSLLRSVPRNNRRKHYYGKPEERD